MAVTWTKVFYYELRGGYLPPPSTEVFLGFEHLAEIHLLPGQHLSHTLWAEGIPLQWHYIYDFYLNASN